jgi:hypothetical protein
MKSQAIHYGKENTMKNRKTFASEQVLIVLVAAALASLLLLFPTSSPAQTQGNNAVYYQSSGSGTCCKGSAAFIDASVLVFTHSTICSTLYGILSSTSYVYPSGGAVIDARGLNSTNTSLTCAAGTTPWNNGSTFVNVPATILLPAGTIGIPTTWVLPQNTHLIGVGDSIFSGSGVGTTIRACNGRSCTFSGSMIQFGQAATYGSGCIAISIENLFLDGQRQSINGIVNQYSEALWYIDHVSLYQILGTGLSVSGSASHSENLFVTLQILHAQIILWREIRSA